MIGDITQMNADAIENAAIHGCAMILNMPKSVKLKKSLANIAAKNKNTLDDCKIVNTHGRQTSIGTGFLFLIIPLPMIALQRVSKLFTIFQ